MRSFFTLVAAVAIAIVLAVVILHGLNLNLSFP